MASETSLIAYIGHGEYEGGNAFRCGALVITLSGVPREFRCTAPVRPNQLQRITYGTSLKPHMFTEVMGKPLVKAMQEPIALYIVDSPVLLALQASMPQPVVYARRQGEKAAHEQSTGPRATELIPSPSGDFAAVIIESAPDRTAEVGVAAELLRQAATNLDILEPFERLKLAMEKVHESKELDGK